MGPVSISHPSAPASAPSAAKAPKYLIRKDGVVLHYNPVLARMGTFQPAEELPGWYLSQVATAMRREAERHAVRATQQGTAGARIDPVLRGGRPGAVQKPGAAAVPVRRRLRPGAP